MDKENLNSRERSRIPLPLLPLPPIPKQLLNMKEKNVLEEVRRPLRAIQEPCRYQTNDDHAGPSSEMQVLKIDARYVTIRKHNEDLDWEYQVFRDEKVPSTPVIGLEDRRVRNIKKSLRRPHSRELQGLPSADVAVANIDGPKRNLNFSECMEDRLKSPVKSTYSFVLSAEYGPDILSHLLTKEKLAGIPKVATRGRACLLNWLIKVHGPQGNPSTLQTAAWYLDSMLAKQYISVERLQLAAMACYWIAQKVHGHIFSSSKLVRCARMAFTTKLLREAERKILMSLNFPNTPVIPQEYIDYLSWWCDNEHPGEIEVPATFILMCSILVDRSLSMEYASVLATAAVLNALLLQNKKREASMLMKSSFYQTVIKKTSNMKNLYKTMQSCVLTVASPAYDYKAIIHHYDVALSIASRIIEAIRNASGTESLLDI